MKITILKEKLKEGVNIVERISQKSLSLPILSNILIRSEKNFVSLISTNLEIGLQFWALAKIDKEGEALVPAYLLSSLLNFLPNGPIELERDGFFLNVKSGEHQSRIKGFDPQEFPILPSLNQEEGLEISSKDFCQGLSQVFDITASSLTRPEIAGVFFQFQKEQIKLVATDSFRLAEKKIFFQSPFSKEYSFILPQLTTREIVNIFGEEEKKLKIYFSPNQVLFESALSETKHPRIHLISRLIEGEFPDYQAIIPKKYQTQVIVSKNEFLNQIKSASLFSGKINEVKLNILPKTEKIEVLSQSAEIGEYKSSISGKIKGKPLLISFNHRFLSDGLSKITSPEIVFEFNGEDEPAVLSPNQFDDKTKERDYLYVIMPIKIS